MERSKAAAERSWRAEQDREMDAFREVRSMWKVLMLVYAQQGLGLRVIPKVRVVSGNQGQDQGWSEGLEVWGMGSRPGYRERLGLGVLPTSPAGHPCTCSCVKHSQARPSSSMA